MKREDLAAMGLTDEQIEKVIAENGKDVQTANAKATKNNAELERLQGIEKEFNAMKDQNLSEQEKAAKQLEEANNRIAELEKAQTLATQRTSAADKFKITSEQAAQVVKDDGSFDFDVLGKIISDKETAAAQANIDLTDYLKKTGDASNTTVTFIEPTELTQPTAGEKLGGIIGKVSLTQDGKDVDIEDVSLPKEIIEIIASICC